MRLLADDGTSLELNVVGYQFPQLVGVPYDSNWLIIAGHVALGGREWKFRDPCLLTNEVLALAEWFEARSKASNDDEFGFIEPNLSFKWRQGVLQVHLDRCVFVEGRLDQIPYTPGVKKEGAPQLLNCDFVMYIPAMVGAAGLEPATRPL